MLSSGQHDSALHIIVLGYIVRGPLGGLAWHHLQYVLGLVALGHHVWFLEDSGDYPSCYNPTTHKMTANPDYGLEFAQAAFGRLGLQDQWAYFDAHRQDWSGPLAASVHDRGVHADLLLNVSGVNPIRPWMMSIPRRVLIDTDPVFTQIRHLTDSDAVEHASRHTAFFTFGENYGHDKAAIPLDGLPWRPTRQPIVMDAWPIVAGDERSRFTTVMQWDSYASQTHQGRRFGMKSDSFAPFVNLPRHVKNGATFELALGSPTAPRSLLEKHGWRIADPLQVTRDPWTYQHYIQQSKAEFTVAKHGYVVSRSGWFSERSACYLATGRPVITQETGFSDWLQTDGGVFAFRSVDEAIAGIKAVNGDYANQCRMAREVAAAYFDSRDVLSGLVEEAMRAT